MKGNNCDFNESVACYDEEVVIMSDADGEFEDGITHSHEVVKWASLNCVDNLCLLIVSHFIGSGEGSRFTLFKLPILISICTISQFHIHH